MYGWEVLNGVGVHGFGGSFPFLRCFFLFFFVFLRSCFVFLRSSLSLLEDKGKRLQFTAIMENFTPTPSAPSCAKLPDMGGYV